MSFATWRQQSCLMAALPRLVAGEPVTAVAMDLGYANPAAFTTIFKRVLGTPPRLYLQRSAGAREGPLTLAMRAVERATVGCRIAPR